MKHVVLLLGLLLVTPSVSQAGLRLGVCPDLSALTTRDQVRERFGPRVTSGVADGRPYDEVRYRGKACCEIEGPGRVMLLVITCGLSELVLLPRDAFRAGNDVIVGHTVRFEYDAWDRVIAWRVDGEIRDRVELPPPADSSPTQP
jgi:hypothetical protein